jgi:hypothetical protein
MTAQAQEPESLCEEGGKLCLTTAAGAATGPDQIEQLVETLSDVVADARRENPNANIRVVGLGSRLADSVTRAILMKSKEPIDHLTPAGRVRFYWQTPEYRANLFFALARGTTNTGLTNLVLLVSDRMDGLTLIPNVLSIFFMATSLQVGIDPFHAWLTNGNWSRTLVPSLRSKPADPKDQEKWNTKFERWKYTEFLAKWYLTQFVVMIVIDTALIPTGAWHDQTLVNIALKTMITSLFSMFAQGGPEGAVIALTESRLSLARARLASAGSLDPKADIKLTTKFDVIRRALVSSLGIASTILGTLRMSHATDLWSVFIPTDVPGAVLCGMGVLGVGVTEYLAWKKRKKTCAELLPGVESAGGN